MIDSIIVKGPLGAPQDHHERRLAHVAFRQLSTEKSSPGTTFISSPLTGAQMEVRYWVEQVGDRWVAMASVKIPLASATIGQNYAHGGLDDIHLEMRCAGWLTRIALTACGFSEAEIDHFIKHSRTEYHFSACVRSRYLLSVVWDATSRAHDAAEPTFS